MSSSAPKFNKSSHADDASAPPLEREETPSSLPPTLPHAPEQKPKLPAHFPTAAAEGSGGQSGGSADERDGGSPVLDGSSKPPGALQKLSGRFKLGSRRKRSDSNLSKRAAGSGSVHGGSVHLASPPHSSSCAVAPAKSSELPTMATTSSTGRTRLSSGQLDVGHSVNLDEPGPEPHALVQQGSGAAEGDLLASTEMKPLASESKPSKVQNFNPNSQPVNNPLSKLLMPFHMMKPLVPQAVSKASANMMARPASMTRGLMSRYGGKGRTDGGPPAGYVWLWLGKVLRWRRRFIVASPDAPGVVMIYKSANLKGKIFSISLRNAVVEPDEIESKQIVIVTGSKGRIFVRVKDEVERADWLACLHESMRLYMEKQQMIDSLKEQGLLPVQGEDSMGRKSVALLEVADMDADQRLRIRGLLAERLSTVGPYQAEVERHMGLLTSQLLAVVSGLQIRMPAMSPSTPMLHCAYSGTPHGKPPALPTRASSSAQQAPLGPDSSPPAGPPAGIQVASTPSGYESVDGDDEAEVEVERASLKSEVAGRAVSSMFSQQRTRKIESASLHQAYSQLLEELRSIIRADAVRIVQLEAENKALQKTLRLITSRERSRPAGHSPTGAAATVGVLGMVQDDYDSDYSTATAAEDAFDVTEDAFDVAWIAVVEEEGPEEDAGRMGAPKDMARSAAADSSSQRLKKKHVNSAAAPLASARAQDSDDDSMPAEMAAELKQQAAVINALQAIRQVEYVENSDQLDAIMADQAPAGGDPLEESVGDVDEDDDDDENDVEGEAADEGADQSAAVVRKFIGEDGSVLPPPLAGTLPERRLRHRLPAPKPLGRGFSVWTILKNMIGKDLSRITMPATINEPTSFLQRLAEAYEYYPLLDSAARDAPDSVTRMMLVAVWILSCYNSQALRVGKPFNPLLGETYEWQSKDSSVRLLCEQVSHHPPVSVYQAEGLGGEWRAYGEFETKTKFWGKSIEAILHGSESVTFPKLKEEYRFNKPIICVHDLIFGKFWVEVYGKVSITCKATGDSAILNLRPCNGKLAERGNFTGSIFDAKGMETYRLSGNILSSISAAFSKSAAAERGESTEPVKIWEKMPDIENFEEQYNFTQFSVELNDPGDPIAPYLPPTDARFRTDQIAMELGDWTLATEEKLRLEEKQRVARRLLKEKGLSYSPKWFIKSDPTSKDLVKLAGQKGFAWKFSDEYWKKREKQDWTGCMDLYSEQMPT